MLVIRFPFEGLKAPRDCSAAEIVEGLVRFKTKLFADECISGDMGLLVS